MSVIACVWWVYPSFISGWSLLKCCRGILPLSKPWWACCLLFGASIMVFLVMWSLQKFQRGYRSQAHMAALSYRCFSFVLLQSLGPEAQSQRGDSWSEPFPCYSQQTHCVLWVGSKHDPRSVLVDFLLLRDNKLVKDWSWKWWIAQTVSCRSC